MQGDCVINGRFTRCLAVNLNFGLDVENFLGSTSVIKDMMPHSHPNLHETMVDVLRLKKVARVRN